MVMMQREAPGQFRSSCARCDVSAGAVPTGLPACTLLKVQMMHHPWTRQPSNMATEVRSLQFPQILRCDVDVSAPYLVLISD